VSGAAQGAPATAHAADAGPGLGGPGRPPRAALVLGGVISLAAIAAVVWWALRQPAPTAPQGAGNWLAAAGALALYAVATCLRAERWGELVRDQDGAPKRADLYALTVVGYAGNTVLPARGGDAFRVLLGAPRMGVGHRTLIGTLLAERLLDVAVLGTLFAVLALTIAGGQGIGVLLPVAIVGAVVAAVGGLALWRSERARGFLGPILASTVALRGRHGAAMLALSILIWGIEGAVWSLCGAALDVGFGPLDGFYVLALGSMFALIPSGPGYAGTVDAAVVLGIRAVGGSGQAAVSYLLLARFVVFVPITLVGLVVGALRYGLRRGQPLPAAAASR
jgi:glycosyltransferase 2 family protein